MDNSMIALSRFQRDLEDCKSLDEAKTICEKHGMTRVVEKIVEKEVIKEVRVPAPRPTYDPLEYIHDPGRVYKFAQQFTIQAEDKYMLTSMDQSEKIHYLTAKAIHCIADEIANGRKFSHRVHRDEMRDCEIHTVTVGVVNP